MTEMWTERQKTSWLISIDWNTVQIVLLGNSLILTTEENVSESNLFTWGFGGGVED